VALFRGIFGPGKDEVWNQFCREIGAEFVPSRFWHQSRVQARLDAWTITFDTYTVSTGHTHITYTRVRAPYVNPDSFRFTVYRKGVFSEFGKLLGMQHIEVGDPEFDEAFILKSKDEYRVRDLFVSPALRARLMAQPKLRFEVKDKEGWLFSRFPADVDELYFREVGVIKDIVRLRSLYELFGETLHQLRRIGAATPDDPGVML
jgi:hypothetical protein